MQAPPHYLSAGGITFAMHVITKRGGMFTAPTHSLRYLHHDYLGSIAAITNEAGAIVESLAHTL